MEFLQLISIATALFMFWLFAQAGIHKLDPKNDLYFSSLIAEYGLSNVKIASIVAKLVGLFELFIAVAIVYPATRAEAAVIAAGLLCVYMINMAYQLYQGRRDLDCGCSGPGGELKMSGHLLIRNFIFVVFALFCLAPSKSPEMSMWVLGILLAFVGIMINLSSEQLIGNAQKLKAFL